VSTAKVVESVHCVYVYVLEGCAGDDPGLCFRIVDCWRPAERCAARVLSVELCFRIAGDVHEGDLRVLEVFTGCGFFPGKQWRGDELGVSG
jgi:hypothetical protein